MFSGSQTRRWRGVEKVALKVGQPKIVRQWQLRRRAAPAVVEFCQAFERRNAEMSCRWYCLQAERGCVQESPYGYRHE